MLETCCGILLWCAQSCPALQPCGLQPARLLCPWDFSGKSAGMPFPTPGDLPDPGIKLASLGSPALVGRFFTTGPPGKTWTTIQPQKRVYHQLTTASAESVLPFIRDSATGKTSLCVKIDQCDNQLKKRTKITQSLQSMQKKHLTKSNTLSL